MAKKKHREPDPPSVPQGRCPGCGQTQRITGRGTWEMHSRSAGGISYHSAERTERCPRAAKSAPGGAHVEWLRAEAEAARHKQYKEARARTLRAAAEAGLYAAALRDLGGAETRGGDAEAAAATK